MTSPARGSGADILSPRRPARGLTLPAPRDYLCVLFLFRRPLWPPPLRDKSTPISGRRGARARRPVRRPARAGRSAARPRRAVERHQPLRDAAARDLRRRLGRATRRSTPLRTEITFERPRTIITRNDSPDISFDRSINPYRGCEHGCAYCYARPTHAYLGLSAGLDFESRLFVKENAAALLGEGACGAEIPAGGDRARRQHRRLSADRAAIPGHPLGAGGAGARRTIPSASSPSRTWSRAISTCSAPMAAKGLAKVYVSVTTLDRDLARRMEPRAPTPERRLEAIAELAEAGVPVGVMVAPDHPRGQRRRDRDDPDPRPRRGRARGRLCHAAAAAGAARTVPRMARRQFPGQAQAYLVAGAIHARRQGLRVAMGHAHGRLWPLRLDDRPALRDRRAQARLSRKGLHAA